MATARFRLVSVARYTSPMPPTPIWVVTSYGPRRVPGIRATAVWWELYGRNDRVVHASGSSVLFVFGFPGPGGLEGPPRQGGCFAGGCQYGKAPSAHTL